MSHSSWFSFLGRRASRAGRPLRRPVPASRIAVERLEESGDRGALRSRHAEWYLELAQRANSEIYRAEALHWLDRLEAEHANVRLAIDRALADGDAVGALRLTGAVWPWRVTT